VSGPDASPGGIDRLIHEPARLLIMSYLAVVESADFLFGNLSSHLSRLEEAGYLLVEKKFVGKKPNTILSLTTTGRQAFDRYRRQMMEMLDEEEA